MAGHTRLAGLPRAEAHQDSKMGRTLPRQLTHTQGTRGHPIQKEIGHLWPKSKGYLGHHKLCGEASWSKQGTSPPQRTAKEAWHARKHDTSQLQQSQSTLCTYRTSGLMISRPGGRGYKARILSHKARSHGSTTASGLQAGNSGCSSAAASLQAQGLLPLHPDNAGLPLDNHLCSSCCTVAPCHSLPASGLETCLSHSKHSLALWGPTTDV